MIYHSRHPNLPTHALIKFAKALLARSLESKTGRPASRMVALAISYLNPHVRETTHGLLTPEL